MRFIKEYEIRDSQGVVIDTNIHNISLQMFPYGNTGLVKVETPRIDNTPLGTVITQLDNSGKPVSSIRIDKILGYQNLLRFSNGDYFITGKGINDANQITDDFIILRISTLGQIRWSKKIANNFFFTSYPTAVIAANDEVFVFNDISAILSKFNSQGTNLGNVQITETVFRDLSTSLFHNPTNNNVYVYQRGAPLPVNNNPNNLHGGVVLGVFDSNLNQLATKRYRISNDEFTDPNEVDFIQGLGLEFVEDEILLRFRRTEGGFRNAYHLKVPLDDNNPSSEGIKLNPLNGQHPNILINSSRSNGDGKYYGNYNVIDSSAQFLNYMYQYDVMTQELKSWEITGNPVRQDSFVVQNGGIFWSSSNINNPLWHISIESINDANANGCITVANNNTVTLPSTTFTAFLDTELLGTQTVNPNITDFVVTTEILNIDETPICATGFDILTSIITSQPLNIPLGNTGTSQITVQLKNAANENILIGGETVVINASSGTISSTTDNGDGTYTATLTAADTPGNAVLSFSINGQAATATATVVFEGVGNGDEEYFVKEFKVDGNGIFFRYIGEVDTFLYWHIRISRNPVIVKTDSNLNVVFAKSYNTVLLFDNIPNVIQLSNGDLIFLGSIEITLAQNGVNLLKIDGEGNEIWIKNYNIPVNGRDTGLFPLQENLFLVKPNRSTLLVLDENGNILHSIKKGNENERLREVVVVGDNIYWLGVDYQTQLGSVVLTVAKLDFDLNLIETTDYQGNFPQGYNIIAINNVFSAANQLIISIQASSGTSIDEIHIASLSLASPMSTSISVKTYQGRGIFSSLVNQLTNTGDGFLVHHRIIQSENGAIQKFDYDLNPIFNKVFPFTSNEIFAPNPYIFVRPVLYPTGAGLSNSTIVKTDSALESNPCVLANDIGNLPLINEFNFVGSPGIDNFVADNVVINDESVSSTNLDNFLIELVCPENISKIFQSPHLYLQAAGSTGSDGTPSGIHLRWLFKNELGEHLPKGNMATGTANYNKADDFVMLFRAPYSPVAVNINLLAPKAVENRTGIWVYQVASHTFALYFRNRTQYRTVRDSFDPITQTTQFLQNYGNNVLELQPASDLFFAVGLTSSSTSTAARVESEIRSVEGSTVQGNQLLSARKTFMGSALANARVVTENGKGFRFRCTNCYLTGIALELYSVLQDSIESGPGWTPLGQFSLSQTDTEVFNRLEPSDGQVNAAWPRFNDGALVNIQNYRDKWNQTSASTGSSIKQTVQDYVSLSNDANNPTALETFSFEDNPEGVAAEDNTFEIPNLLLLQQAAMDFHVARMLGLGHLDTEITVQNNNPYVYLATYQTNVSLVDGDLIAQPTEHRYITVPTARTDERLPVPIALQPPVPGIFTRSGLGESNTPLTDNQGYTQDGKTRFVSLFVQEPEDPSYDRGFYHEATEFNLAQETFPVFVGVEYKGIAEQDWRSPELANTPDYQNVANTGQLSSNETVALPIPDEGTPLFVHRETENGQHTYGSYGINWFSRITRSGTTHNLDTALISKNTLDPPGNRSALLITEEQPLLLTTANEQLQLGAITGADKTLIRLLFNYHTTQELISYQVTDTTLNGMANALDPNAIFPDSQEVFADEVEIYFRDTLPLTISGRAQTVVDDPDNVVLSIITTTNYRLDSEGEDVIPNIPQAMMANFVGGVLVLEEEEYIIHSVEGDENSPTIRIYKKQASDRLQDTDAPPISSELLSPTLREDGRLLAVENLQNTSSWGMPNPHPLKVQIGNNWAIHREVITRLDPDGLPEQYLEKTRGIWDNATLERVLQPAIPGGSTTVHMGQYKATFGSAMLADHPQASGANPVQWYRGILRVHTTGNPNGDRRDLEVYKIENIGTGAALVVYFKDKDFRNDPDHDEIQLGGSIQVNFYPGYRIHLFANAAAGITASSILPQTGEGIKYTCFGFRSLHNSTGYASRIAVPTVMFAQEEIAPSVPQLPLGAQFATRPDSFGKATYTFTTQFDHTPHGTLFYRTDDSAILNALYTLETVTEIREALSNTDDSFLPNRWQNLLGFAYEYPGNSFQTDGLFAIFPETGDGYRFPNPNNPLLFMPGETPGSLTPGSIANRIQVLVQENFVPLTEIPLLYEHINGADYDPIPKKQVVRDRNGQLLLPTDANFDMAPMAKIPSPNSVQFTDFNLDGTSNNLYFYASRELGSTMQMGDYSPILGPIKLVNTNPPITPGVQQLVPILENPALGIAPGMEVSVNAYPKVGNIKKLALYRALNATDALSVRSMQLVSEVDPSDTGNSWKVVDSFTDLPEVPFGDPLFYRVVALREIQYPDKDDATIILTDFVASPPSKLMVTAIVENTVPTAPELSFTSDPVTATFEVSNVVLQFDKTVYKGKYLLFKLNDQGQWVKIHEITTNDATISIPLENTDLGSGTLRIEDGENENQSIYHQFKVDVENTAGLISQESNILTIPDTNNYDGIGGMGIEQTFIIR